MITRTKCGNISTSTTRLITSNKNHKNAIIIEAVVIGEVGLGNAFLYTNLNRTEMNCIFKIKTDTAFRRVRFIIKNVI